MLNTLYYLPYMTDKAPQVKINKCAFISTLSCVLQ